jgi:hypothetical protein
VLEDRDGKEGYALSDGTQEARKIFCNTCKTSTNHALRARYAVRRHDYWEDDESVMHGYRYSLWSCAGCDEVTLQWEMGADETDEGFGENLIGEGYFPTRQRDLILPEVFKNLNREMSELYNEVVTCFNEGCLLLCTIGLRTLIEGVCKDKGLKDGNLEHKVKGLIRLLPSLNMIEALHALRDFGNFATHELKALSRDDARIAIQVMEDLLNYFYDMDYKASRVRNPRRAAFNSIKPGSVQ